MSSRITTISPVKLVAILAGTSSCSLPGCGSPSCSQPVQGEEPRDDDRQRKDAAHTAGRQADGGPEAGGVSVAPPRSRAADRQSGFPRSSSS